MRDLRTCLFIGELDGMEPCATDIWNSYLEALTSEKVCIRAGPEFGDLEGHLLIIYKASIYMRKCSTADHYEYIATYIDELVIIMKDPQSLIDQLTAAPYHFKLKGSGPLKFHLGC